MVVHQLQSYIEQIPGGAYSANLRELIKEELLCTENAPTIVFDASSSRHLFKTNDSPQYNGQPRLVKNSVERFVKNIISCGVHLIVVLRGVVENDVGKWFYKRMSEFRRYGAEFLRISEKGVFYKSDLEYLPFLDRNCLKILFASIKNDHYTVFTSSVGHTEIAKMAIKENCLAVVGQDSNYLIYEGIRYYISMKSLNPETLDCLIYDRNKLMEHLGLKSYQLPLFATLCGNDVVPHLSLQKFHKTVSLSLEDKFLGIAQKVRYSSAHPYEHIKEMLLLINHPQVNEDLLSESFDMYLKFQQKSEPPSKWGVITNERQRTNKCDFSLPLVLISKKFKFSSLSGVFENDSIPSATLLRPLRKRVYGILLHEDDFPPVKEYCLEELIKFPIPNIVFPENPGCEHPGLISLWTENTPDVCNLKWALFCSSLGQTLSKYTVRNIPTRLLVPTLALQYLYVQVPSLFEGRQIFKEKFEFEAFLVTALLMVNNLENGLLENEDSDVLEVHLSYLSCCFIDTCFTFEFLNDACGLLAPRQELCISNFYDGILLHNVYRKMREGAKWKEFFDGRVLLEATYSTLMEIILNNAH